MPWQEDFDVAHAEYLVAQAEPDFATVIAKCKTMLEAAESIGEEALPILDGLVFVLELIPTPPTKIAGAGLAALLVGARALKDKIQAPGGAA